VSIKLFQAHLLLHVLSVQLHNVSLKENQELWPWIESVFRAVLRKNSCYFRKQRQLINLCNGDAVFSL